MKLLLDLLAPLAMGAIACYLIWTEWREEK